MGMKNSLSLTGEEVKKLLEQEASHVIRIKMPLDEKISFNDLVHGEVNLKAPW